MKYLDIIKAPVVTEKSALLNEKMNMLSLLMLKQIKQKLRMQLKNYLM